MASTVGASGLAHVVRVTVDKELHSPSARFGSGPHAVHSHLLPPRLANTKNKDLRVPASSRSLARTVFSASVLLAHLFSTTIKLGIDHAPLHGICVGQAKHPGPWAMESHGFWSQQN